MMRTIGCMKVFRKTDCYLCSTPLTVMRNTITFFECHSCTCIWPGWIPNVGLTSKVAASAEVEHSSIRYFVCNADSQFSHFLTTYLPISTWRTKFAVMQLILNNECNSNGETDIRLFVTFRCETLAETCFAVQQQHQQPVRSMNNSSWPGCLLTYHGSAWLQMEKDAAGMAGATVINACDENKSEQTWTKRKQSVSAGAQLVQLKTSIFH